MLQNPNSARKNSPAGTRRNVGTLKRDINLLPANDHSAKIARMGVIAVVAAICLLGLVYAAILLPNTQLKEKQDKASALSAEAAQKAKTSAQFDASAAERDSLKFMLTMLEVSDTGKQPADLMALIGKACPDSITALSIELSGTGASIDGNAPDDKAIAQFITNLKALGLYEGGVELTSSQAYGEKEGEASGRFFKITADYLPPATPTPQPTATPTATQEGGDGK